MAVQQIGNLCVNLLRDVIFKFFYVRDDGQECELRLEETAIYAIREVSGDLFPPNCSLLAPLVVFLAPGLAYIGFGLGSKCLHLSASIL